MRHHIYTIYQRSVRILKQKIKDSSPCHEKKCNSWQERDITRDIFLVVCIFVSCPNKPDFYPTFLQFSSWTPTTIQS